MQLQPLCTPDLVVKTKNGESWAKAIRCKRWSCETCAEINRRKVIGIARRARPKAMLTLTISSKDFPDPDEAAQELKRGLRLLRLRLRREKKLEDFQFLAVFEKHKSGNPHLHLLIRGKFIPWKWLRQVWESITGSYQVDIRQIKSTGMAALYCAKYIGKDLSSFAGCKRWWRSHNYSEEDTEVYEPLWPEIRPTRYEADIRKLRWAAKTEGWSVEKEGENAFIFKPPKQSLFTINDILAFAENRVSHSFLRKDWRA